MGKKINVTDEQIIDAATTSLSGAAAAVKLGIKYNTFRVHAKRLGVFLTNQSGKGIKKAIVDERKFNLKDILGGEHPQYPTGKLKRRLLEKNIFVNVCSECGVKDWNNKKLVMQLDHIDGNSHNHKLENLRMLCPNCHSQTDTYCGKNVKNKRV
jgi:5-methylcytosine-specific restriction endonuclease McrA